MPGERSSFPAVKGAVAGGLLLLALLTGIGAWAFGDRTSPSVADATGGLKGVAYGPAGPDIQLPSGSFGLRLSGVGRGSAVVPPRPAVVSRSGATVRYERGGLIEWYRDDRAGIEQGFTMAAPPLPDRRRDDPLVLRVRVVGPFRPRVEGSGVRFVNPVDGSAVAEYGQLAAVDANGRRLAAAIAVHHGGIVLTVDDAAAAFPITVDPLVTPGMTLTPLPVGSSSDFGGALAVSGDGSTLLVGGGGDYPTGAVWVFVRSGSSWVQQGPKLTPSDGFSGYSAGFGASVALSADGSTALIGGPYLAGYRKGEGAVWIFKRDGSTWAQQGSRLEPADESDPTPIPAREGSFGASVALSADGSRAIIGDPSDRDGAGSVWIYDRSGLTWVEETKLAPSNAVGTSVSFGWQVACSADGTTVFATSAADDQLKGAAWAFTTNGTTWTQAAKIVPTDETGPAQFGESLSLSVDAGVVLIGGTNDDGTRGAAWVFARNGSGWDEQAKLVMPSSTRRPEFGLYASLSADGNVALIGSKIDSAWLYQRSGTTWTQQGSTFVSGTTPTTGRQDTPVALSPDGMTAFVGRPSALNTGSVFVLPNPPIVISTTFSPPAIRAGESVVASAQLSGMIAGAGGTVTYRVYADPSCSTPAVDPSYTRTVEVNDGQVPNAPATTFETSGTYYLQAVYSGDGSHAAATSTCLDGHLIVSATNLVQQGLRLTPSDQSVGAGDSFGSGVAISADGRTALVAAPFGGDSYGPAWVMVRSGAGWTQQGPKLSVSGQVDSFGSGVALSADGNTALIGGSSEGDGAWVLTRDGSAWTQQGPVLAAGDDPGSDCFGCSVALSADGNTALIGASMTTHLTGIWLFKRSGSTWSQQGPRLLPSGAGLLVAGGISLSADGRTAAFTATGTVSGQTVTSLWVYRWTDSGWEQDGPTLSAPGGTTFGRAVALSGDGSTIVIASNGTPNGAALVFRRGGAGWAQEGEMLYVPWERQYQDPALGPRTAQFGYAVSISSDGSTVLVGARREPNPANGTGAAYVFLRKGGNWLLDAKLSGATTPGGAPTSGAFFGAATALSADGNTALVGGPSARSGDGAVWAFATAPALRGLRPTSYALGAPAIALAPDVTVDDRVSPTLSSATIRSAGQAAACPGGFTDGDVLSVDTTGTGLAATYSAGTLTISGVAPLAVYRSLLARVVFSTTAPSAGTRQVAWSLDDGTATSLPTCATLTVSESTVAAAGVSLTTVQGRLFSGEVATFTAPPATQPDNGFAASVLWGDGESSAATIVPLGGGAYSVAASHIYHVSGQFSLTVTIRDLDDNSTQATATSTVQIAPAPDRVEPSGLPSPPSDMQRSTPPDPPDPTARPPVPH